MVAAISSSPKYLNHPCCAPIKWICDKIIAIATSIFSYLIRIVTFQLGEMKAPGAYTIMRIYQRLTCDPREEKPFDPVRLADSKRLLQSIGGVESVLNPADGNAQIHCMMFKAADFKAAFERQGAQLIDIQYDGKPRKAFIHPPPFADKLYFHKIEITMPDGSIAQGALMPEMPQLQNPPPMILHCHSPGRSMCMDRKFIALHLAAGYDVTVWDPRGTAESTGRPSEGGYYYDADAVFQHVIAQGYPHNRIYASGFCEGAACAAYLKKKYHHMGIHYIAGNLYTSMKDVVEGYGWMGRLGASFGLDALKDPALPIEQDYFDNVTKFSNLPRSNGKFILIHTDTDKMMPRGSVQKIIQAIHGAGPVFEILRVHPDERANGHLQPPYEDPVVWHRYVQVIH